MTLARQKDLEVGKKDISKTNIQKTQTFVTFYMGDFLFGISADKIVEINKDLEITPVPLAEDYILGIMNLRGQIVPVINLAKKIKLSAEITPNINLIIRNEEEESSVSLVIEKIGDILEIPINKLEKTPEKLEGLDKEYIKNVYQLPDKLVLVLDVDRLMKS